MKKIVLNVCLILMCSIAFAQNGLENIIVEKYYISNAADSIGSIGVLPVGSTTYRIYADMLPGYKFQAAYGVPGHALLMNTTTSFFNNEDRGATTPTFSKTNAVKNTVMLDSWLSVGAACSANFGILKSEDDGVANAVNFNGILQNNNAAAGIPLTTQDGFFAGLPEAVTFVGLTTELDVFDATSQFGNSFVTSNGSWASLLGSTGPVPATNKVLIAQITTNGCFSFELNVQIGTPSGGIQNYVARNPVGNEILLPGLVYNKPAVTISSNPSTNVCPGTSITFTATPSNGGATPVYQWKKNNSNVGTNSPVYSNSNLVNGDVITCKMTSNAVGLCSTTLVTSNSIIVGVNPAATATITPTGPTTFCSGTNALTLTANGGTGLSYQWFKGTTALANATNISYNPSASSTYKVRVTNSSGCTLLSSGVAVTVNALPTATITTNGGPTTFCSGTNPLILTANAGTGFTYQWFKSTTAIAAATNISYVPTSSSTYKVQVANANGCTKSSTGISVTVNSLPTATITAQGPTTFCAGDSVVLTASSGTGYTYQWLKSNVNISGATSINYTAKTAGSYKVVITKTNGCSKTSSGKTITVNCRTTGTSSAEALNQMQVFPNPSTGEFTVSIDDAEAANGMATIQLINVVGKVIYTSRVEFEDGRLKEKIQLGNDVAKGLYLLRTELNGTNFIHRLIIN